MVAALIFFALASALVGMALEWIPNVGRQLVHGLDVTYVLLFAWASTQGSGRVRLAWMGGAGLVCVSFLVLALFDAPEWSWIALLSGAMPLFIWLTDYETQTHLQADHSAPAALSAAVADPPAAPAAAPTDLEPALGEVKRPDPT